MVMLLSTLCVSVDVDVPHSIGFLDGRRGYMVPKQAQDLIERISSDIGCPLRELEHTGEKRMQRLCSVMNSRCNDMRRSIQDGKHTLDHKLNST